MNAAAKRVVERMVVSSGLLPAMRLARRRSAVVLSYHNIVPHGVEARGDSSLHLPQNAFARQLDALMRTHDVVPLAAVLEPSEITKRPRVAITFDDAYEGALDAGVRELVTRGLPATVFVAPALLGLETWWDQLAIAPDGGVPEATRRYALETLHGNRESVLEWAGRNGGIDRHSMPRYRIGNEEQLRAAASQPNISLGSHTWSHQNLSALDGAELIDELAKPLVWLEQHFGVRMPMLTYPYGLHSLAVDRAAAAAGHAAAFRVDGGWLPPVVAGDSFALPRYNVPAGLSLEGFQIRLAGIGA